MKHVHHRLPSQLLKLVFMVHGPNADEEDEVVDEEHVTPSFCSRSWSNVTNDGVWVLECSSPPPIPLVYTLTHIPPMINQSVKHIKSLELPQDTNTHTVAQKI